MRARAAPAAPLHTNNLPIAPGYCRDRQALRGGVPLGAMLAKESFASAFAPECTAPLLAAVRWSAPCTRIPKRSGRRKVIGECSRTRRGIARRASELLASKFDFITEIRGEGLMVGVQLSVDGAPLLPKHWRRLADQLHA